MDAMYKALEFAAADNSRDMRLAPGVARWVSRLAPLWSHGGDHAPRKA